MKENKPIIKETPPEYNTFNGFSLDTFEFFKELEKNNNTEWFDKNRARFKESIDNPLRDLIHDVGQNYIKGINSEFEIEPKTGKTMGRINKNNFGNIQHGVYFNHHWAAFYNKNSKKQESAQLYVTITKDYIRAGFYIAQRAVDDFKRFKNNLKKYWDVFIDYIEQADINKDFFFEIDEKEYKYNKKDLYNAIEKCSTISIGQSFGPDKIDLISKPSFKGTIIEIYNKIYPIYLFANSDKLEEDLDDYFGEGEELLEPEDIYSIDKLIKDTNIEEEKISEINFLLEDINKKQVVFYGPPGTGKTFVAEKFANYFIAGKGRVETIQFHPSYTYEEFIEGLRPETIENENGKNEISYRIVPGVFKEFCEEAGKPKNRDYKYVLIIDEINRGNIAKIFGELLFLLEYRDKELKLPYSKKFFSIPSNVYIIGTMNTSDRSIALVDYALRRRFSFIPFFAEDGQNILSKWLDKNNIEMKEKILKVYNYINSLINDEDFKIGYSYFMIKNLDEEGIKLIWKYNIKPLLEEYFFNDLEKVNSIDIEAILEDRSGKNE